MNLADRETAFFALLLAFDRNNLRVRGDELQPLAVHHEEAQREAHLRRGQADALRRVHRLEHVRDQFFQLRAELLDGRAHTFEHPRRVLDDLHDGHARSLAGSPARG